MLRADEIIRFLSKFEVDESLRDNIVDFIEHNRDADVHNFFVQCRKKLSNGNDIVTATLTELIKAGASDRVRALFEACPPQSVVRRFYQIGVALSDFYKFDIAKASELLRDAVIECIRAEDDFTDLCKMVQICFYMESVSCPDEGYFHKPSLEILTANSDGNSPYTCAFICDSEYCRYYAERFIHSLRQHAGDIDVFALVVNPDQNALDLLRSFDGVTVAKTEYGGEWVGEFCTCARFMLANDIVMRVLNTPTIFMDVDSLFPEGSRDFLQEISHQPLCYAEVDDVFPTLRISASVIGARPCEDAEKFFDFSSCRMREGMAREGWLWGLDQFSLYRAVCHGLQNGWNMVKIDECLGRPKGFITDFFSRGDHVQPLDQRKIARTNYTYRFDGFGKDKRVLFSREHAYKEINNAEKVF